MGDGARPEPGGWNRIHFITDDLAGDVERLQKDGVRFRNDIVTGPGGSQILAQDPAGNLIELSSPHRSPEAGRLLAPGRESGKERTPCHF